MHDDRQPPLPKPLLDDARAAVTGLARNRSPHEAAVLVHAGAIAQHAAALEMVQADSSWRSTLKRVADLHPGLTPLASLPDMSKEDEGQVSALWQRQRLMDPDSTTIWWSYPLGDLYQALSDQARKQRALCQTPWWITELLIELSYDQALELTTAPRVIDPSCGTGHILVEALHRAAGTHRVARSLYSSTFHYPREEDALTRVHGVDLDPYAVLIARWRLLVKAWSQIRHRAGLDALAALPLQVAHADTLLATDEPLLQPGRYDVVLANPPYITPRDKATSDAIRERYPEVCYRQYSLALPFHARMMDLLVPGGWCAQLTSNAFMKREYGRRYIEDWLPKFAFERCIDTSGVHIPGHGTPTVILVHRNQSPTRDTLHTIRGVRGEPSQPAVPAKGVVWTAIADAVRSRLAADEFEKGAIRAYEEHVATEQARDAHERRLRTHVKARWDAARRRDRDDVTRWARDVLDSTNTIWISTGPGPTAPLLAARLGIDTEPIDLTAAYLLPHQDADPGNPRDVPRGRDVAGLIRYLAGHQLVTWHHDEHAVMWDFDRLGISIFDILGDRALRALEPNLLGQRYARWLGLTHDPDFRHVTAEQTELMLVAPPTRARDQLQEALTVLHEMAAGDPTPERLAAGRARQHTRRGLALLRQHAYVELEDLP